MEMLQKMGPYGLAVWMVLIFAAGFLTLFFVELLRQRLRPARTELSETDALEDDVERLRREVALGERRSVRMRRRPPAPPAVEEIEDELQEEDDEAAARVDPPRAAPKKKKRVMVPPARFRQPSDRLEQQAQAIVDSLGLR